MLGEISMEIMFISRILRQRGENMDVKEIVEKSKQLCKEKTCSTCPLQPKGCIDKYGTVHINSENELIELFKYLEKKDKGQPKENQQKETKGRGEK